VDIEVAKTCRVTDCLEDQLTGHYHATGDQHDKFKATESEKPTFHHPLRVTPASHRPESGVKCLISFSYALVLPLSEKTILPSSGMLSALRQKSLRA
jgi:hypothetical protein